MGKKIDSIKEMYSLGLPVPRCIFILENENIDNKLEEYFNKFSNSEFYTIRTDTENYSMSCKRQLTASRDEICRLSREWHNEGFQIILQEFIDEKNEIKSGNLWLKNEKLIIEGNNDKHIKFTNGKILHCNCKVNRFEGFELRYNELIGNYCFSFSELYRLIRQARKIPYVNAIIEFSFFNNGSLYFWEIKKEVRK